MSEDTPELLNELRQQIKDDRRRALLDAYLRKQDWQSITEEALALLSKAIK